MYNYILINLIFADTIDYVYSMYHLIWSLSFESVLTSSGTYNYLKLKITMGQLSSSWEVVPGGLTVMMLWRLDISSHPWWAR